MFGTYLVPPGIFLHQGTMAWWQVHSIYECLWMCNPRCYLDGLGVVVLPRRMQAQDLLPR